jgi:hypothetical protein
MTASILADTKRSLCFLAALGLGACGGGSSHPGLAPSVIGETGGFSGAGGHSGSGASAGRSTGGHAGKSSAGAGTTDDRDAGDGAGGTSSPVTDGGGGVPAADARDDGAASGGASPTFDAGPPIATVCPTAFTMGTPTSLGLPTAPSGAFGGVTPDELSIVWTTFASSEVTVNFADRASAADHFSAPTSLVVDSANQRVTISADGLRIAYVKSDGKSFGILTRAVRPGSFQVTQSDEFSALNANMHLAADEALGDPLYSADDTGLYFSIYGATRTKTLFTSARLHGAEVWSLPRQVDIPAAMDMTSGMRRRVNAVSSDGWTLFYFDETDSQEHAVRLDENTGALRDPKLVGDYPFASSAGSCARLYYSTSENGIDLRVVSAL